MLGDNVLSEVSIQYSHLNIYDSYNICELLLNSKLSSFLVSVLRSICEAFGLGNIGNYSQAEKAIHGLALKLGAGLQL